MADKPTLQDILADMREDHDKIAGERFITDKRRNRRLVTFAGKVEMLSEVGDHRLAPPTKPDQRTLTLVRKVIPVEQMVKVEPTLVKGRVHSAKALPTTSHKPPLDDSTALERWTKICRQRLFTQADVVFVLRADWLEFVATVRYKTVYPVEVWTREVVREWIKARSAMTTELE